MRIRVKWEPRDMWIGVYRDPALGRAYLCLVPCVPIILERTRHDRAARRRAERDRLRRHRSQATGVKGSPVKR